MRSVELTPEQLYVRLLQRRPLITFQVAPSGDSTHRRHKLLGTVLRLLHPPFSYFLGPVELAGHDRSVEQRVVTYIGIRPFGQCDELVKCVCERYAFTLQ